MVSKLTSSPRIDLICGLTQSLCDVSRLFTTRSTTPPTSPTSTRYDRPTSAPPLGPTQSTYPLLPHPQATEDLAAAATDVKKQIALQSAIKFNGGGHINHSLFWENLTPPTSAEAQFPASGPLADAVTKSFGSVDALKAEVNAVALGIQGSGWAWLAYNPKSKALEAVATANQDPLIGYTPLVGIDLWEHAFYLDYKNVKPDYLKAIWTVVNWKEAEKRFVEGGAKL